MLILHANWIDGGLRLWAESLERYLRVSDADAGAAGGAVHPFAVDEPELRQALLSEALVGPEHLDGAAAIDLSLPCADAAPLPSDRLASAAEALKPGRPRGLRPVRVPSVGV